MFEFSDELNMTLDQVQLFQSYRYVSGKLALCGIASIDLALLTFAKKITTDPVDNEEYKFTYLCTNLVVHMWLDNVL